MTARVHGSTLTADQPALADLLTLEPSGDDVFRALHGQPNRNGAVYGGQLLGQAMRAAEATVEDRRPHAMQACFERAADSSRPIDYRVARVLDGGSETLRRVSATQDGHTLLTATVAFGAALPGFAHAVGWRTPPPDPATLPTLDQLGAALGTELSAHGRSRTRTYPQVEVRPVEARRHLLVDAGPAESRFWLRAAPTEDDRALPEAPALVYLSDYLAVNAALAGHVPRLPAEPLFIASLNHSLWFHGPFDPRGWLYYELDSPWTGGGRAVCNGRLFDPRGGLVASVVQETLLRPRRITQGASP